MNRYPFWRYVLILIIIIISALYALPNIFPEIPAIQISVANSSVQANQALQDNILHQLQQNNIQITDVVLDNESLKISFPDQVTQIRAKSIIEDAIKLNNEYMVTLHFMPNIPTWMVKLGARPMYLGLDLRGGVHFLMQVDMEFAYTKKIDSYVSDIRKILRKHKIRHGGVNIHNHAISIAFQNRAKLQEAEKLIRSNVPNLSHMSINDNNYITIDIDEQDLLDLQTHVIQQNIHALNNRVNALGVTEPIVQQSGQDRIMIQLPGAQNTAQAKNIIGRTASLEVRMVANDQLQQQIATGGMVPAGYELIYYPQIKTPILVSKQVELTGDNINSATSNFTDMGLPAVNLKLDSIGSEIFYDLTKNNHNKQIAIILIEQDSKEVVTAPRVNEPISGGNVQISGNMNQTEATNIALLLQSGSLAAPMKIIEERIIGPSTGQENIQKGFHSVLWGFLIIITFMILYYRVFGIFSAVSLITNLIMLIALLSIIQATLTLPGIAAIALTLGMAIDANVLINERIREELRSGLAVQVAISKGYKFAWDTIFDSNITSLIAGLALLIFSGSGPVKGFAVVHCLGILTSMFSSVVVSRALVNLWYGKNSNITHISIGTIQ